MKTVTHPIYGKGLLYGSAHGCFVWVIFESPTHLPSQKLAVSQNVLRFH